MTKFMSLAFALLISLASKAQFGATITRCVGSATPTTAYVCSQQCYKATFGIPLSSSSVINWNVVGGTVLSSTVDPAGAITVTIQWHCTTGTGSISITDAFTGQWGAVSITRLMMCLSMDAGADKTICQGSSTTIGPSSPRPYTYSWLPTTSLSSSTASQPTASPAQTTTYTMVTTPTDNKIQNPGFESGFTGFSTDYVNFPNTDNFCAAGAGPWGSLTVVQNPASLSIYCSKPDHTSGSGNQLVVDASCGTNRRVWYQTVNVQPSTTYYFSGWASPNNFFGSSSEVPSLRVRVGSTDIVSGVQVPWGAGCNTWYQFTGSWNSGSATSVTIAIYDDNTSRFGNDFSIDDLYFGECTVETDQVTVTVNPKSNVSPGGPIDYYFPWEVGAPTIGITLSSSVANGNQWYKDGVAINGAIGATFKAKLPGVYTVASGGCAGNGTSLNAIPWGQTVSPIPPFGTSFYPAGITSPLVYCYNSTGKIRTFDLTTAASYFWEVAEIVNTPPQPVVSVSQTNPHSYEADITVFGPPPVPATTFVVGCGVMPSGYTKAMEFLENFQSPFPLPNYFSCPGSSLNLTNYNFNTSNNMNPGQSGFEWETYDFGPGSTVLTPNPILYPDPSDPTNTSKIRVPGRGLYSGGITVSWSTMPASFSKYFYSSPASDGECYRETRQVIALGGCRPSHASDTTAVTTKTYHYIPVYQQIALLHPNPATTSVNIKVSEPIQSIFVYDVGGRQVKAIRGAKVPMQALDVSDLPPGIYALRVIHGKEDMAKLVIYR